MQLWELGLVGEPVKKYTYTRSSGNADPSEEIKQFKYFWNTLMHTSLGDWLGGLVPPVFRNEGDLESWLIWFEEVLIVYFFIKIIYKVGSFFKECVEALYADYADRNSFDTKEIMAAIENAKYVMALTPEEIKSDQIYCSILSGRIKSVSDMCLELWLDDGHLKCVSIVVLDSTKAGMHFEVGKESGYTYQFKIGDILDYSAEVGDRKYFKQTKMVLYWLLHVEKQEGEI